MLALLTRFLILVAVAAGLGLGYAQLHPMPERPAKKDPITHRRATDLELEVIRQHFDDGSAFFIDARSDQQRAQGGRLRGAFLMEPAQFSGGDYPMELDGFSRTHDLLIVFCSDPRTCESSDLVTIRLKEFGFEQVHTMAGGFAAWIAAGHPVEGGR